MIRQMTDELRRNGVELRKCALVKEIFTETSADGHSVVTGLIAQSQNSGESFEPRTIRCESVLSNANLKSTVLDLVGAERFRPEYISEIKAVRVNTSSCQVYMGIREGEIIPNIGDLVFTSESPTFSTEELTRMRSSSRTFSVYYPDTRPHSKHPRYTIVASINARWANWQDLTEKEYKKEKQWLIESSIASLEKLIPDIRTKLDHVEAATPRTIHRYTRHMGGTSFGTKFEGLAVSQKLPDELSGLYHAGSVGIIMSGWLGTMNYGVIVANKVDKYLSEREKR